MVSSQLLSNILTLSCRENKMYLKMNLIDSCYVLGYSYQD